MTKLLRVYNKEDKMANKGNVYFLVLPENYDNDSDEHYQKYIFPRLVAISGMAWQKYTSYMIGTADVDASEMVWSEITGYELKECKIDVARVNVLGRYRLPDCCLYM
jgi:hypothetical protein